MRNESVPDVWVAEIRPLRPLVVTWAPDDATTSIGAAGDISMSSSETVVWADDSDHTQTFGDAVNGFWQWYVNLFPAFDFAGAAGYFAPLGGSIQGGTLQLYLDLLDASSTVLTSASMSASYSVDLTTILGFTYTVSATQPVWGSEKIPAWNAVRVRCTCGNTNLNELLNYGAFGVGPNPTASVYWPADATLVENIAALTS
jgi:hypothetical protein